MDSKFTDLELEHPVEGDITIPGAIQDEDAELSTLDEPVKETIVRDSKLRGHNRVIFILLTWIQTSLS